ncbi:MAG: DUF1592 domain-containing protein [Planctomycetota bacterium]|nr:DUF1592 domain-containing protein [Planctomycetota bacterium]
MICSRHPLRVWPVSLVLVACFACCSLSDGDPNSSGRETKHSGPGCLAVDDFFATEVWPKVGERLCLKCHRAKGDAKKSKFLLQNTSDNPQLLAEHLRHNYEGFGRMAAASEDGKSRLLLKVTGGLDHGGEEILKPDSTGYHILERFVQRMSKSPADKTTEKVEFIDSDPETFFAGVKMCTPQRLLRRVTLSLTARLPTPQELAAVKAGGLGAMDGILDQVMKEDAFYERLVEGFNDIFLTLGYDGNAEEVLSYDHFEKTRHWTQTHDLSHIPEEKRQRAQWALADVYRKAMINEPLELIEYIVRNDRPFTELATADYIMVSPYTSRGYGIYEELKDQFKDPEDPFEYIPARLKALKGRSEKVQESATGFYPHAGFLGMFHYLRRYPSTVTNRNRLRARMYYQHFLGVDIMALAPRVSDAAAITAKYDNPTMEAPDCVVCHKTVDPVAGLFQDYFNEEGHYGPRKEGWFTDMFKPGLEGDDLPDEHRWRSLQWLGERTAKDPRFATAMVEHVYYILMGRKVMLPPEDIDDPLFAARRRTYEIQREEIQNASARFAMEGFNLKAAFKSLVASRFYRVDGLVTAIEDPRRRAELEDIGLVRLMTPEQLERKLKAVFGMKWGRLEDQFKILYGGIDSKSVTERMTDPSGAMGAIQRIMANDIACKNVALDFTTEPGKRRLFPDIEPSVLPETGPDAEMKIRKAIVHLHQYLLGLEHPIDHPEVERTYGLFVGIVSSAKAIKGLDNRESYFCRGVEDKRVDDPDYTVRAWRGVVTYLLRQHDFLYE